MVKINGIMIELYLSHDYRTFNRTFPELTLRERTSHKIQEFQE